nr:PREDICTED: uncharacterized protein LOC109031521 [Bemisia tabaci]
MNVIQFDVEETTGKILDSVTHSTGGPGGCIFITTHEQYREVRKNMGSGVMAPNISFGYQLNNPSKIEKCLGLETIEHLNRKVAEVKREQRSVCTSTGNLDVYCKQKTQKIYNPLKNYKQMKPESTKSWNGKDGNVKIERRSICTSTGDLDTYCKQETQDKAKRTKPKVKPKPALKRKIILKTRSTQTEISMGAAKSKTHPKSTSKKCKKKSER